MLSPIEKEESDKISTLAKIGKILIAEDKLINM